MEMPQRCGNVFMIWRCIFDTGDALFPILINLVQMGVEALVVWYLGSANCL